MVCNSLYKLATLVLALAFQPALLSMKLLLGVDKIFLTRTWPLHILLLNPQQTFLPYFSADKDYPALIW